VRTSFTPRSPSTPVLSLVRASGRCRSTRGKGGVVAVDIAALVRDVDADPERKHALDDGNIQDRVLVVVDSP